MICPPPLPAPPAIEAYESFDDWLEARDLHADRLVAHLGMVEACHRVEVADLARDRDVLAVRAEGLAHELGRERRGRAGLLVVAGLVGAAAGVVTWEAVR